MAVLLHDRSETAGQKQREALRLPRTSAVVALFAFSSRMDRDSMRLFARTHGDEVRAAAIASTGQEVLELLHGGLRPQVLVLDALLTKPSVTQVLQEIGTMQPDPEPAVLVLVPVPEETAARKALGLFAQYRIMLRLGDQASDAATAALLHGTCVPQPIDLLGQLREFCSILQEEAAQYALPFTVTLQADGLDVLPTTGDVSLLNGLLTNLVSNTLAADRAAHIMLLCTPGRLCYRDNGPGLPPDAAALLTEGQWSERLLHAGGLGLPLVAAYTSAMGWALTVGEGPGMSLQFTLPAAPPLDGMVLTSPTERLADRQNRRRLIRRELAVLVADTSMQ